MHVFVNVTNYGLHSLTNFVIIGGATGKLYYDWRCEGEYNLHLRKKICVFELFSYFNI